MIRQTFIHIPGIGETTEQKLWSQGVCDWDSLTAQTPEMLPARCRGHMARTIAESMSALSKLDACYFAQRLEPRHHWRLYPTFRHRTGFLDIETTGMGPESVITTIALYDGKAIRTYVRDKNLEEFAQDIQQYQMLVTYNGRSFDIPCLQREFPGLRFDQPHCDLRHFLASLGYKGGLKGCERTMGIPRSAELREVDGFVAVLLWQRHIRGDKRALPALLRYNIEDAVNLQWLMETAYNLMLTRIGIAVAAVEVAQRPHINWPFDASIIQDVCGQAGTFESHWLAKPQRWK